VRGWLELPGNQTLAHALGEVSRLADLLRTEDGAQYRGDPSPDPELQNDCIHVLVGDVRVIGERDANPGFSPIGKARGLATSFWAPITKITFPAPHAYEPSWLPEAEAMTSVPFRVTA